MYHHLCSWENILLAYHKASKGKRGQPNVAAFEFHLEDNLIQLQDELCSFSYQPEPYDSFYIHEPKRRLISAAPFRDRVVHHALCNLIEPIFERSFIHTSFANRRGKGTHRAIDCVQQFARSYRYTLQCDVLQFFPSIDHQILMGILAGKLTDPGIIWLCERILASGAGVLSQEYQMHWFPGDDLLAFFRPRGLPIGNLTSQFWANVYLNGFDHFVKRRLRCPAYARYVDDICLFGDDKAMLWDWKAQIEAYLAGLRLEIHPGAQPCPVEEGLPFLGFTIYPQKRRLKRRKGIHFQRKLRNLVSDCTAGEITFDQLEASVQGWVNHVRYGNTVGLRKAMLAKTSLSK